MNSAQIEQNLQQLVKSFNKETFIYDFLLAYGLPKASISKLKMGSMNLSKAEGEIVWKKKLFFRSVENADVHEVISAIQADSDNLRHEPRFIVVTDNETLLAVDTKTADTLDIPILDLPRHYDFFLPWAGMEKAVHQSENPADVKAAERMAKLYDEIDKDNPTETQEQVHNLNVFLSRLLFCFFAEDTGIFDKSQFTHAVSSHTQMDGSDLNTFLDTLFEVMNTSSSKRMVSGAELPAYLQAFPYVNGGLFRNPHQAPLFTRRSRQMLVDSGDLDWSAINPDIFGSMIQAVVTPEHRGGLGMHYTSVPNIMKVIEPLFLNELKEEFETGKNEPKRLNKLLDRISKLKIFDPACGSGNFLIIAYKELRTLEISILQQLQRLQQAATGFEPYQLELIPKAQLTLAAQFQVQLFTRVQLSQFYGIELDDFAHEIAVLSLWLAQHQMNTKFKEVFGTATPTLPLRAGGNITQGNAIRLDWEEVCPKLPNDEIYILGNPPYLGAKELNKIQKADMDRTFDSLGNVKRLDYISCWFKTASDYISGVNQKFAFVSTNSICQGEQVSLLWPYILSKNQEIFFCYQPFDWGNNAKSNAGVTCIIVGVQVVRKEGLRMIFDGTRSKTAKNISPYLIDGKSIIINQKSESISDFPKMILGSSGFDGGYLILSVEERNELIKSNPESHIYIRRFMSGDDFMNDKYRYCLWIEDNEVIEASKILEIKQRIEKCRIFRLDAGRDARKAANVPHRFFYRTHQDTSAVIFPKTASGRREYIPSDFAKQDTIISNAAFVVYTPDLFIFSILSCKMHKVWMEVTSAKMRSDFRYSVNLTYNTFPFPPVSRAQKQELEKHVYRILEEREAHSEKTLAQLYDPDKMPDGLREAHRQNDLAVERCYRSKPFESDEERLEYLFKLYEQMIAAEKDKGTLFEKKKRAKK